MKITTPEQLAAAKEIEKKAESVKSWFAFFDQLSRDRYEDDIKALRTAIAEYETRSVELTEDELIFLKYAQMDSKRAVKATSSLISKKLIEENRWAYMATEAGRAYLESLPKLRWEVWNGDYRVCQCDDKFVADFVAFKYNENRTSCKYAYEVREVQS